MRTSSAKDRQQLAAQFKIVLNTIPFFKTDFLYFSMDDEVIDMFIDFVRPMVQSDFEVAITWICCLFFLAGRGCW